MKPVLFLSLLTLFYSANLFAQSSLPPVFEIKNDTAKYFEPDNAYWQILEEKRSRSLNTFTRLENKTGEKVVTGENLLSPAKQNKKLK